MIGSKSPLAYGESYELTTIADGIQYDYEIVRQQPAPVASLINSFPTNKKSGTTVKVEVRPEDEWKLHLSTVKQLTYFDNVIVTNEINYYDNHFKIIDHPLFMVRSDKRYPFQNEMHIVIGQVPYPINWSVLGIKPIQVPVGLKFDIGTIPVDLSRESIRYVDDADESVDIKRIIIKRINEAKEILRELYISKLVLSDIDDYMYALNNPKTTINLGGYEVYFGMQLNNIKHVFEYKDERFSFSKDSFRDILKTFEIRDLSKKDGLNIKNHESLNLILNPNFRHDYVYSHTGELEHWSSLFHKSKNVIRRNKLTKQMVYKYAAVLGLTMEQTCFGRIRTVLQSGAVKKVFLFIKAIEETLIRTLQSYEDVPQAFIDEEKAKQEALKEERKGNITYYNEKGNKTVVSLKSLIEDYQYVFYVSRDAPDEEKRAYMALYNSLDRNFKGRAVYKKRDCVKARVLVVILSPSVINKVKNKTKELSITRRVKIDNKKVWQTTTKKVYAFLSADKMFKYTDLYNQYHTLRYTTLLYMNNYDSINLNISNYYKRLCKSIRTTPEYRIQKHTYAEDEFIYPYLYFREQIDAITKNRNYYMEKTLEELIRVADPLYMISQVVRTNSEKDIINTNHYVIVNHLIKKYKLTKLNPEYYGNI